ncbi:glycosyltransferase family 4 protein [Phocaeicola coprocola]|uniref:Glycosyltransferase family 1 protein n=1 Tax=Phocaeicola coprocola TaxID=310298 RepID=A0A412GYZ2_9BACT|nr:glycosyltransferase family 4 protein [Phocaeicola coprocola]RGS00247.1 glycosyltransferase family 1 protein [Phocaeicola coprocola]
MKLKSIIYLLIEKLLAPWTDKIVCISIAEKESAKREKISDEKKLVLIPNGIDISKVKEAVAIPRHILGISDNTFVVGMIGRVSPQKAPDVFIKAAKLIQTSIPDSAFIIVGDGEEVENIKEFAKQNNLKLIITGWTDQPYSYLKVFDVALLLSRWEGFGLAIVEYMAAEKNVVASRVDAIPTLINDGKDGLLVDTDNPEDACAKVLWLYDHPKEAFEMRKKALEKVYENYDINRVVFQHIELFKELYSNK